MVGDIKPVQLALEGAIDILAVICTSGRYRLPDTGGVIGDVALQRSGRVILALQELVPRSTYCNFPP